MESKTVFVTGASGFVGQHLVERLCLKGMNVRCLVRPHSNRTELKKLGVDFIEGDILNREALVLGAKNSDIVFHLAGLTRSIKANDFMLVNCQGCRNIAWACLEAKKNGKTCPTLVSVSSLSAAGPASKVKNSLKNVSCNPEDQKSFKYLPKEETEFPHPISPYGRSKWAGEKELISFATEFPISIVRPPFVFGEGDRLSLPLFKMVKNSPIFLIPGYFNQQFSFIYVNDLVEILIQVSERGERLLPDSLTQQEADNHADQNRFLKASKSFGISSAQGIYFASHWDRPLFSEFGRMLAKSVGRQKFLPFFCPPLGVIGTGVVQECWKKMTGHSVSFDWNKAIEALSGPWICSTKKLEQSLNFRSSEPLQVQIQQTADWYSDHKWI